MSKSFWYPLLQAAGAIALIALIGILSRPLFPVDETRYVTVAWEMFTRHDWILATLNFQPYGHKPPLLFWLIMSLWTVFGATAPVAMLAPYLIFIGLIAASIYLIKSLLPENETAPRVMMCLTLGSFPLLLYSNLILFDMLLSIFVVIGMTSIWNFSKTGKAKHLIIFALAVGLGALAKGPAILLNLIFPILLLRVWLPKEKQIFKTTTWSFGFFAAIIAGALLALSWAIPAAIKGGPEFANKIFIRQTVGRLENSFDHAHPFYWYLPWIPLLLCPWILMPSLCQKLKNWAELSIYIPPNIIRFLLCWIIPVFISFSFISGKQIHYLFPCLIGAFALITIIYSTKPETLRPQNLILPAGFILFLTLLPAILKFTAYELALHFDRHLLDDVLLSMPAWFSIAGGVLSLTLILWARNKSWLVQINTITVCGLIFMGVFHLEARNGFYKNYDLRPMARVIEQHKDRPMAFIRNYHGEWGFLAKVEKPVEQIMPENLDAWFKQHPNGMAFFRTSDETEFRGKYDTVFEMPFKTNKVFVIIVPKGTSKDFNGKNFVQPQQ